MKRGKNQTLALLLFSGMILLFNWPLLSIFEQLDGARTVCSLFAAWILALVGLGLYSRQASDSPSDRQDETR